MVGGLARVVCLAEGRAALFARVASQPGGAGRLGRLALLRCYMCWLACLSHGDGGPHSWCALGVAVAMAGKERSRCAVGAGLAFAKRTCEGGIVLLGSMWSTACSSVCRLTVAGGVISFAKGPARLEGRVASLATAAGWSRGSSLRQSRRQKHQERGARREHGPQTGRAAQRTTLSR